MLSNPKVVIVIPCYNEEHRLNTEEFRDFAAEHPEISLLFVDDGSSDGTWSVLSTLCNRNLPNLQQLRLNCNQGKAEAVRQGLIAALKDEPDFVGFWDADLATPLEPIIDFVSEMTQREDLLMVTGCRLVRLGARVRRRNLRHYLGRVFATIVSNHLKLPVYDSQCGAKVLRAKAAEVVVEKPFSSKWFFDVEIFKRLIKEYGRDRVSSSVLEFPLIQWLETPGSKLKLSTAFFQLLVVLRSKP